MATTVRPAGAATTRLIVAGRLTRAWSRARPVQTLAADRFAAPAATAEAPACRRFGPFDSIVNLVRMTLAVIAGMVLGAFICAALGF
jgi:hypothetical protein